MLSMTAGERERMDTIKNLSSKEIITNSRIKTPLAESPGV
jgi:hypothetical protein